MALKPVPFTDAAGVVWIEMRDVETDELVSRERASSSRQSAKVRLEEELRQRSDDWWRWRNLRAEVAGMSPARVAVIGPAAGLTGMTQAQVVAFLQAQEDAGLVALLSGVNEWRGS